VYFFLLPQTVGIVPPSITNSLPVMAEALSDARKATLLESVGNRLARPFCAAGYKNPPAIEFICSLSVHISSCRL